MKILLATDGSEYSKAAVESVVERSLPPGTEVQIVSVYERTSPFTGFETIGVTQEYYAEIDSSVIKAAEEAASEAAKILKQKKSTLNITNSLSITTVVLEGSPKDIILNQAESFGADLIVVGSHGRGAVERFLIGSVSQAVALHAKCSVEIVRNRKRGK